MASSVCDAIHGERSMTAASVWSIVVKRLTDVGSAVTLGAIAAGAWMSATGLESWRRVAFVHDTNARQTPIPFGRALGQLRTVSGQIGNETTRTWTIIAWSTSSAEACQWLQRDLRQAPATLRLSLLVLDSLGTLPSKSLCPLAAVTVPTSIVDGRAFLRDSTFKERQGFVVVDTALRVIYGSRLPQDVAGLPGIASLFVDTVSSTSAGTRSP